VVLSPGAAHAAGLFTVRLAPSSNPFLYVEVAGASTAATATIDQWSYTDGDNQVWTFAPAAGYYEIINQHSGKCIWTDGVAGSQPIQAPCTGSRFELWSINAEWISGNRCWTSTVRTRRTAIACARADLSRSRELAVVSVKGSATRYGTSRV
jgi:hypothetical protein